MTDFIDRDELRQRLLIETSDRRILDRVFRVLYAMSALSCYTCHYGDDHMLARCSACRCGDMWTALEEARP